MRLVKPILIVVALAIALLGSTTASADRFSAGGGYKGGYYRGGGHYSGHYHGRGYYGGYYGGGVGVVIGGPFWGPSWYYPPYYYPYYSSDFFSPPAAVPSSPPVYIERSRPEPSSRPSGVWYYCPDSKAYYPYVKECPGDWQTVPAQPPERPGR